MNVFYTNTIGELYNSPRKFKEGTIAISGENNIVILEMNG